MSSKIPNWEKLNKQQLPEGTISIFCSIGEAISEDGTWHPSWNGSMTLTIAKWERHGEKTRIHRTRSLSKLKITDKNCCLVPIIFKMIQKGEVPKNIKQVKDLINV